MRFSLLGDIVGQKPLFHAMTRYMRKNWPVQLVVSLTDRGVFIFRLENQHDVDTILSVGHWTINGIYPLLLRQWEPGMVLDIKSLQALPVWIILPDLDLQFWTLHMLGRISSMVGKPRGIDKLTCDKVRLYYARLLLEVDASKPLKEFIMLKGQGGEVKKQAIVYEFRPYHCPKCSNFGHTPNRCPLNNVQTTVVRRDATPPQAAGLTTTHYFATSSVPITSTAVVTSGLSVPLEDVGGSSSGLCLDTSIADRVSSVLGVVPNLSIVGVTSSQCQFGLVVFIL